MSKFSLDKLESILFVTIAVSKTNKIVYRLNCNLTYIKIIVYISIGYVSSYAVPQLINCVRVPMGPKFESRRARKGKKFKGSFLHHISKYQTTEDLL